MGSTEEINNLTGFSESVRVKETGCFRSLFARKFPYPGRIYPVVLRVPLHVRV